MQNFYWFAVCVAANGFLLLLLTVNVSRLRIKHRISYGDGGNKQLMTAIRVHGNGTEQVPVFALVILALSFLDATSWLISSLVISFTLSRLVHAIGMLGRRPELRRAGAAITYLSQAVAVLALMVSLFI